MHSDDRRGTIVILFAISLTVVLGFAALVVDLGYQRMVATQLQHAADAVSHGAAQQLDGTQAGMDAALVVAHTLAAANNANGHEVQLEDNASNTADGGIVFGIYDFDLGTFTPDIEPTDVNAVQINLQLADLNPLFSGVSFGTEHLVADGRTTSAQPLGGPAGAVECMLPIALSSCTFDTYTDGEYNYIDFRLSGSGDPEDELGWASLSGRPNARSVTDQLSDCEASGPVEVADEVYLNNGTIASALSELAALVSDSDTEWDTGLWGSLPAQLPDSAISSADYGNTWEGPVAVFDSGGCSNVKFNQSAPVVGFAWGVVYDVVDRGSDKSIRMRIESTEDRTYGTSGGGEIDAGVIYSAPPVIVQ